ncbi:hypothetical protein ABID95_002104 [Streptomyces atratus]
MAVLSGKAAAKFVPCVRERPNWGCHLFREGIGPPDCTAPGSSGAALARAILDAATTERTMLLAEIYRRGPVWRLRAVGQGYDHGLDALARGYGVHIAE